MTSRRDQVQTLGGSVLVTLAAGTNYVYSAYAPQMGMRLNLSNTQLNIIGIAGNLGVYLFAPVIGSMVDRRGPKLLLYVGSALLFLGYGGIRFLFTNAHPAPPNGGAGLVFILVLCSFATGLAGCAGIVSAVNAAVKVFPAQLRASMIGVVNSAFGLSAFFFSLIARELFPGKTEAFLTVLFVGTTLPVLVGAIVMRPKPGSIVLVEEERDREEEREEAVSSAQNEATPLRVGEDCVIYGEGNVWASQASTQGNDGPKLHAGGTEDVHGLEMLKTVDFWVIFGVVGMLGGPGLMYINNVGSIVQALFAANGDGWDETAAAAAQAYQVSIISVCSSLGRLIIGFLADYISHKHAFPRASCLILCSILGITAQSMLIWVESADTLWKVSLVLGLSYGTAFALFSGLILERFGIAHFSQNAGTTAVAAVLLGNVFNYGFGRNFDAHSGVPPDLAGVAGNMQCYVGRRCYVDSIYFALGSNILALGLGVVATWRSWKRARGAVVLN